MVHAASGFRGTRVGVAEGSAPRIQPNDVVGERLPRIRVSYWCAKGHETRPVFIKLPEDQIPVIWDCRRCGGPASRDESRAELPPHSEEGYKSHLEYVKERRSSQDAEDVLAGALERLRTRGTLSD
ncbi:RNA polymerase-binding protein RbpA [Arthrobacter sp. SPG23]|uniref:RNA polymerase-binding protein RbpA n=1 Tax=Arthrobacter sp. SPG23 TaxID=1610703 RepID=UPI0005BA27FC|nr:RNA polymerase-binding protein RbpA [Arthrobacter sp. SPG23]